MNSLFSYRGGGVLLNLLLLALLGCIDGFKGDLRSVGRILVVEGLVTNDPGPYSVTLSWTEPYASGNANIPIEDAQVWIIEAGSRRWALTHQQRGVYTSDSAAWRGQVGRTYALEVRLAGEQVYQSTAERLVAAPAVDTVRAVYVKKINFQGVITGTFDLVASFQDAPERGQFYQWQWAHYFQQTTCNLFAREGVRFAQDCCGACWGIVRPRGQVLLAADAFVNGNRVQQTLDNIPYNSKEDYFIAVELRAIPATSYQFWQTVAGQINNTGGIFDRPPAAAPTNIFAVGNPSTPALGVFTVAGLSRRSFYVRRDGVAEPPYTSAPTTFTRVTPCAPCSENFQRTSRRPEGWRE